VVVQIAIDCKTKNQTNFIHLYLYLLIRQMKIKNLLYLICLAISFFSCKRNSEIDELGKNETAQYPLTCYNKIQDQDETGIDCGGKCKSCATGAPATPSCTVSENTMIVNNVTYTALVGGSDSGAYYTINGIFNSSNNYQLTLKSAPDQTKVYSIDGSIPDQSNEAAMQIQFGQGTVHLTSGKVYFKNNGSSYTAVICSGSGLLANVSIPVKGSVNFQ
jgi:hypothetical protein